VIRFVILETAEDGVYTLDTAKATDEVEDICSTDSDTTLEVLEELVDIRADAVLNPHCAYSTRATWYLEALNPKYKAPNMGERKFKHGFSVAKILNWLDEDGNDLEWGRYIGGKPQMKDPKSLGGRGKSKGRTTVRRRR
jgi:hypothetical protein